MKELIAAVFVFIQSLFGVESIRNFQIPEVLLKPSPTQSQVSSSMPSNTPKILQKTTIALITESTEPTKAVVGITPMVDPSYDIDYGHVKSVVGLNDEVPQKPTIPPGGFIQGVSIDFTKTVTSDYLHKLQKAKVENLVFECQTANPGDWKVVGAHNVFTWKKYSIDYSHGHSSDYQNLISENPGGIYASQREDLRKTENYYCKNGRKVLYLAG